MSAPSAPRITREQRCEAETAIDNALASAARACQVRNICQPAREALNTARDHLSYAQTLIAHQPDANNHHTTA
jgi:hypothetical protein